MKIKLYTDGKYYYTPKQVQCDKCREAIEHVGWHHTSWFLKTRGREPEERIFCNDCMPHETNFGADIAEKHTFIVGGVPERATMYISMPPTISDGKPRSTFDLSSLPASSCQDSDSTVEAGRLSISGAQVGKSPERVPLPTDDDMIQILYAEPIVEAKEQIEHGMKKLSEKKAAEVGDA